MRSELLQRFATHLEFLGYEVRWDRDEDDDSEEFAANHEHELSWIGQDFAGGAQLFTVLSTNPAADGERDTLLSLVNELNGKRGIVRYYLDDENDLLITIYFSSYDKTAFGRELNTIKLIIRSHLGEGAITRYLQ